MPILFMALIALVVFGGIGILLTVAMLSEHRKHRADAAMAGAPFPPEPPETKARAASSGI